MSDVLILSSILKHLPGAHDQKKHAGIYHGTSVAAARKIMKEGLRFKKAGRHTSPSYQNNIFGTSNYEIAKGYGRGEKSRGKYAVITLRASVTGLSSHSTFSDWHLFQENIPPEYIERIDVYSFKSQGDPLSKDKLVEQLKSLTSLYVPVTITDDDSDYELIEFDAR